MPASFHPLSWLLQALVLFVGLSVYGAMWRGAQDHRRNGWFVALLWTVAFLVLLNTIHAYDDYLEGH